MISSRIPFLLSSITNFMLHPPKDKPTVETEIASVAGITCDLDLSLQMPCHITVVSNVIECVFMLIICISLVFIIFHNFYWYFAYKST